MIKLCLILEIRLVLNLKSRLQKNRTEDIEDEVKAKGTPKSLEGTEDKEGDEKTVLSDDESSTDGLSTDNLKLGLGKMFNFTAEDYYYKAYNNESDYQYQIDNYTKCLRMDPNYGENDGANVYYNRGNSYSELENYKDAIVDYTMAIRINPGYASAYTNRGIAKQDMGLSYCSDYKRACDLGKEECCRWYKEDNCTSTQKTPRK